MKKNLINLTAIGIIVISAIFFSAKAQAASLYGVLFETGHLIAINGLNKEALLMYAPNEEGFIALTSNDTASEWWISDSLGLNWTLINPSPLVDYNCTQPGRHTFIEYHSESYFAASCGQGTDQIGYIFKLTSIDTVEVVHILDPSEEGMIGAYPTANVLNDKLYMFFNGGFTEFDGTVWIDKIDALGQAAGVPLEVSSEQEGYVYLAQTSGQVQKFDGISYETIGEDYLEGAEINPQNNLPAIEIYNNQIYVGNQDFDNGATLFRYLSGSNWENVIDLPAGDRIINKMQLSDEIDGSEYLVFYTSNSDTGTNIYAINKKDNLIQLIDSGLGGTNPQNNNEVVSIVNRSVTDGVQEKQIMIFATQNITDQTKIFVLNLDKKLAINASATSVISSLSTVALPVGHTFKYKIKKAKVKKGATYSLWINNKKVAKKTAVSKRKITLSYKGAKKKKIGDTFSAKIGVRYSYGQGEDQIKANNLIKGEAINVVVQ